MDRIELIRRVLQVQALSDVSQPYSRICLGVLCLRAHSWVSIHSLLISTSMMPPNLHSGAEAQSCKNGTLLQRPFHRHAEGLAKIGNPILSKCFTI